MTRQAYCSIISAVFNNVRLGNSNKSSNVTIELKNLLMMLITLPSISLRRSTRMPSGPGAFPYIPSTMDFSTSSLTRLKPDSQLLMSVLFFCFLKAYLCISSRHYPLASLLDRPPFQSINLLAVLGRYIPGTFRTILCRLQLSCLLSRNSHFELY